MNQICQQCRTSIDADATRCPNCGKRPYPLPGWLPAVYVAGAVLVVVLGVWFVGRL